MILSPLNEQTILILSHGYNNIGNKTNLYIKITHQATLLKDEYAIPTPMDISADIDYKEILPA